VNPLFSIEVKPSGYLFPNEYNEIISLCSRAFEEDFTLYLQVFDDPIHILCKYEGKLVSHVLWITRWLHVEDLPLLRTAYVEGVATEEAYRRKGYATSIMQRLTDEIQDYDIAALSPADTTLYARLGWEYWQGPLYARKDGGLVLVPDETAMILRTSKTPDLDIHKPISIEWREGEVW
jgi:aminoglycoside 2'-N-acetyltransferase I